MNEPALHTPAGGPPLVSVIIPVYNAAAYVARAIDSALGQRDARIEVVVVDDGSTDGTAAVLAGYGERIRVVRQDNGGPGAASNAGVAASRGDWIAFLDADDVFEPAKVSRQLAACADFEFSYTDSVCVGAPLPVPVLRSSFEPPHAGDVLEPLLVRNFVVKSTVMMRRSLFVALGGFDARYRRVDDWPFWIRCAAATRFCYVPEPLTTYLFHEGSLSTRTRETLCDHLRIIDWAFSPGGPGSGLAELRPRALSESLAINADFAARAGDWQHSLRCALGALRYRPGLRAHWKRVVKAALMPLGFAY